MSNTGELLKRTLSASTYQRARSYWWYSRFYLPNRAASLFVRDTPNIHGFPVGHSELVQKLRSVNVLAPTRMCRVMTWHGSDKGQGWHNYTTVYSKLFGKLVGQPLRIFELGLGTDNPTRVSTMGVNGRPGASLRGWRELFPHALIYGADIDRDILFQEERIETFYCDQLDPLAIRDLWSNPALKGGMDLIIEDGLHTFEGNISFLNGSLEKLRPNGFYVIEDIDQETLSQWREYLGSDFSKRFPSHECALVELPNPHNEHDNNLLIIRGCK